MVDRADTEHRYFEAGRLDVLTYALAMLMSNVPNLQAIHERRRAGIGRLLPDNPVPPLLTRGLNRSRGRGSSDWGLEDS